MMIGRYVAVVHYYPETVCNRHEVEAIWEQWLGDIDLCLEAMHARIGTPSPRQFVPFDSLPR